MALGGPAVPEQPESGFQRQPLPTAVLTAARLQCQALVLSLAPSLLLPVMGQL